MGLVILLVFSLNEAWAYEKSPVVEYAQSCFFVDSKTGNVLFAKNENSKMQVASLAKIVMALVAIDKINNLNVEITATSSIFDELHGQHASSVGIVVEEKCRAIDLLHAALIASACEAASILACYVGNGSIPNFVVLMNQKAKELGASNTHFVDPHGLSDKNYSTASDVYLFARALIKNPLLAEMVSKVTYEMPPTNKRDLSQRIYTTNQMLIKSNSNYYKKIKGIKTGTCAGYHNFVSYSEGKDMFVIGVVLGALPSAEKQREKCLSKQAFPETKNILEWIFENFRAQLLAEKGEPLNEVKTVLAKEDHVRVVLAEDVYGVLPKDVPRCEVVKKFSLPKSVKGGAKAGTKVGSVIFLWNNSQLAQADLVLANDLPTSLSATLIKKLPVLIGGALILLFFIFKIIKVNRRL
jgi:D-alanyl-D-alanine carboxypeptidase (penicillin-binding protein 5/6)